MVTIKQSTDYDNLIFTRDDIRQGAKRYEIKNAGFLAEGILRYFWTGEGDC
jgi:hypothetical protein